MNQDHGVCYRIQKRGMTHERFKEAVCKVGPTVRDIHRHLG